MKKVTKELWDLIEKVVESVNLEMLGAEFDSGKAGLLRVYIDSPSGVGIEDCSKVSRELGLVLDIENPIPGKYTLEVSSPGVDRPLFLKKHFEKVIGETIVVKMRLPDIVTRRKKFVGILEAVNDDTILIIVDNETFELALVEIQRANLRAKI